MIQYREIIIKRIIQSTDRLLVEPIIDNSLQKLIENGTHPFIVIRFIDKLKASMNEIKINEVSDVEQGNIIQALNVLNNYDVKKINESKIENI